MAMSFGACFGARSRGTEQVSLRLCNSYIFKISVPCDKFLQCKKGCQCKKAESNGSLQHPFKPLLIFNCDSNCVKGGVVNMQALTVSFMQQFYQKSVISFSFFLFFLQILRLSSTISMVDAKFVWSLFLKYYKPIQVYKCRLCGIAEEIKIIFKFH